MTNISHGQLVDLGSRWLRMNGFGVVSTDLSFTGLGAKPDAIGFRTSCSAIVVAMTTRTDFAADARKPWRTDAPALGVYRFYLCPEGLIAPEEVPERWGLLYEIKGKVKNIVVPKGNLWLSYGDTSMPYSDFLRFQHRSCEKQERLALYTIAQRSVLSTPLVQRKLINRQSHE